MKATLPVVLESSTLPKVSSPLVSLAEVGGAKKTETRFSPIIPCENRLSVTTNPLAVSVN